MAKKNKPGKGGGSNKGGASGKGPFGGFRDMSGERELKRQMAKAEKLAEQEEFDEALEILMPLAAKYPRNDELLELLGMCYIGIGFMEQARDTFEQVIDLLGKAADPLQRFQLASTYAMTGFPTLAYEQLQLVNFAELSRDMQMAGEINEFRINTQKAIESLAEDSKLTREAFLRFMLPLERGQLAIQRDNLQEAFELFQEARSVNPKSPLPFISLASVYELEGKIEETLAQYRYILQELEGEERETYGQLIRVLVGTGRLDDARAELQKLEALPPSGDPSDVIRVAEAYARFEDDAKVYELLKPLAEKIDRADDDEEVLAPLDFDQLQFLLAVASLHKGQRAEAQELLGELVDNTTDEFIERTLIAVTEEEEGPRPNKRFYYFTPTSYYPAIFRSLNDILLNLINNSEDSLGEELKSWFATYGQAAHEVFRFILWTSYDPILGSVVLTQTIKSGIPEVLDLAKEVVFGKIFSDPQRLAAATALIESGHIKEKEKVTLWLNKQQKTGTVEQLTKEFTAELQKMYPAMGDLDFLEDDDDEQ